MRVALVGTTQSGKSTLFTAVASADGGEADMSRPDQAHLATIKVPDERLIWLEQLYKPRKTTPAELEFLDLPGFDLTSQAGRNRSKSHWAALRQSDMIVFVVRAFSDDAVAAYRERIDPKADLAELQMEMLFADLEQVTNRREKLESAVRKPTADRNERIKELELMNRLAEALENERAIADEVKNEAEEKMIRSFAFLSMKPFLVVVNCNETYEANGEKGSGQAEFSSDEFLLLSAGIESEIAQLEPAERAEFLSDMGIEAPARDRLIRACYERLNLVDFLTVGEDECRAWTIPAGTNAVIAAGKIHSDIARGFIRAETVSYKDLRETGDMKAAKAAGKVRLEGKDYIVRNSDIINFRFNV